MKSMIKDAYIAVEVKAKLLAQFSQNLMQVLTAQGLSCEPASSTIHVSIAYADGDVNFKQISEAASEIANGSFFVRVGSFEIFSGQSTPYDYLALNLEAKGAVENAQGCVENRMRTKTFANGFKGHVSLLRFRKGELSVAVAKRLVRELNASQGAAFTLGRQILVEGEKVCVFGSDRECLFKLDFISE